MLPPVLWSLLFSPHLGLQRLMFLLILFCLYLCPPRLVAGGEIERSKNCGKRDLCTGRSPSLLLTPGNMTAKETGIFRLLLCHILQSIYAVSSCPESAGEGLGLAELCRKSVPPASYHYTLDVPVFSRSTQEFYANVHCGLCHRRNLSDLQPVHFKLLCDNTTLTLNELLEKGQYKRGELAWELRKDSHCSLSVEYSPEAMTAQRDCLYSLGDCPAPRSQTVLAAKCRAYSLPLILNEGKVYKNAHCALCNGVEPSKLSCWHGLQYRGVASLVIIFDFDWDFASCDLPHSVWDGLHQCCTNANDSLTCSHFVSETNHTAPSRQIDLCNKLSLKIEGYLTLICLSASIFCLFLHIVLSYFFQTSKNLPGKILNSLSYSLLIAQLLFLTGIEPVVTIPLDLCQVVAVLIQFFFLSSFLWMNVMSVDIWRTFSNSSFKGQTGRSHTKYACYAWGTAGLVSLGSVLADLSPWLPDDYRPYFAAAPGVCWFASRIGLTLYFFLPISALLCLNVSLFAVTVAWFQRQHQESDFMKTSGRREYTRLWLYIKLFIIMGLTWGCGMISTFADKPNYRYPFIIFNGLQGAFLFIMFDLKWEVVTAILGKASTLRFPSKEVDIKPEINGTTQSSKLPFKQIV